MKFAHLADCHLGAWRDVKLRKANADSFRLAVEKIINAKVDFALIAGDLFNTAVPAIDSLRIAVEQLKKLKDFGIPVYTISGSHDFSPSGKTMLDVLDQAGLVINVARGHELPDGRFKLDFTVDQKTSAKITGMIGKKGGLEVGYYHFLAKEHLEQESGTKIFLFHTALSELKQKGMEKIDAMPLSLLPSGFSYYAGGHVHILENKSFENYSNIVYPGPIFPNSFSELEKLKHGSFVLVEDNQITHIPLVLHPVISVNVNADNKTTSEVESFIRSEARTRNVKNSIVTIRCTGCLRQGKQSDINWNDILHDFYANDAHVVLRNTAAFTSREIEVVMVKEANVDELESSLITEHASQMKLKDKDNENNAALVKTLMRLLSAEKKEGERISDFETNLHSELDILFS